MNNLFRGISGRATILVGPPLIGEKEIVYSYILSQLKIGVPIVIISIDFSPDDFKRNHVEGKVILA